MFRDAWNPRNVVLSKRRHTSLCFVLLYFSILMEMSDFMYSVVWKQIEPWEAHHWRVRFPTLLAVLSPTCLKLHLFSCWKVEAGPQGSYLWIPHLCSLVLPGRKEFSFGRQTGCKSQSASYQLGWLLHLTKPLFIPFWKGSKNSYY